MSPPHVIVLPMSLCCTQSLLPEWLCFETIWRQGGWGPNVHPPTPQKAWEKSGALWRGSTSPQSLSPHSTCPSKTPLQPGTWALLLPGHPLCPLLDWGGVRHCYVAATLFCVLSLFGLPFYIALLVFAFQSPCCTR